MKRVLSIILTAMISSTLLAQNNDDKPGNAKQGWNFGLIPVVSYNSDLGFQYGGLTNIYYYGDGKVFPKYYHSIYAEVSRYTKGSGIFRLFYDTEFLIPGIRLTADLSYLPDQALDFYGFNGYDAVYNKDWTDDSQPADIYRTRMYYKHQRNILRFKADFQGKTGVPHLNWAAGYEFLKVDIGSVPVERLNRGRTEDTLPHVNGLYDDYIDMGIIGAKEADGGIHHHIKAGLVFDTRDNEPCPMEGVWTEIVLLNSIGSDFKFGKLAFTHRQYFTVVPDNISLAYRIGYQGIVYGDAPFYMLPYMVYSYMPSSTLDGLGGSKSVRGMIRNRLVADGVVYANFELRYKFVRFRFINQNWYLAINPFFDCGRTLQKTDLPVFTALETYNNDQYIKPGEETFHFTYGAGLHISMNENFVIAAEAGIPMNKKDGGLGIYIGMNWLF